MAFLIRFVFLVEVHLCLVSQFGTSKNKWTLLTRSRTGSQYFLCKIISNWKEKHIMLTVYRWLVLKEKVSRVCTDHQKGVVTEWVTWECGEVGIMLDDGAAIWLPATLTLLSGEIPACSNRVWTLHKAPQSHIHPTAQRLQRDSLWKWDTGGHSHDFISMWLEANPHALWCDLLILWTILWYIWEVRV